MRKIKKPYEQSNKLKSPFINYCVTAVSCLIIACAAFCFMFFKTDIIVDIDGSYTSSNYYNKTSVETIINNLKQEANEPSINNEELPDVNVPGVAVPTNDLAQDIINRMKELGYNDYAICGAIGNFMGESSLEPKTTQGHVMDNATNAEIAAWVGSSGRAIGFAQWDGSRATSLVQAAISKGVNWYDWNFQRDYYLNELSLQGCDVTTFNSNSSDIEHAVYWFAHKYERPGISRNCPGYNNPNKYCASQVSYEERSYINGWTARLSGAQNCHATYFGG